MVENTEKTTVLPAHFESDILCLRGTFEVEGMTISEASMKNLERIATGQATYQQVIQEILAQYNIKLNRKKDS